MSNIFPINDITVNTYTNVVYTISPDNPYVITGKFYDNDNNLLTTVEKTFKRKTAYQILQMFSNGGQNNFTIGTTENAHRSMDLSFFGIYSKALTTTQTDVVLQNIKSSYLSNYSNYYAQYDVSLNLTDNTSSLDVSFSFIQEGLYMFRQDHNSNTNHLIVFRTVFNDSVFPSISHGTPGSNAYVLLNITNVTPRLYYTFENTDISGIINTNAGDLIVYYVKVVPNIISGNCYAFSIDNISYQNQPNISFNAFSAVAFDTNDICNNLFDFTLGTVIDNSNSEISANFISETDGIVTLNIDVGYTGNSFHVFDEKIPNMGYVPIDTLAYNNTYVESGFTWRWYDGYWYNNSTWGYKVNNIIYPITRFFDNVTVEYKSEDYTTGTYSNGTFTNGYVLNNSTNILNTLSNGNIPTSYDYKSAMFYAYFIPKNTGVHTFRKRADNTTVIWILDDENNDWNDTNIVVNPSVINDYGDQDGTITLNAGQVYFMRIIFGEEGGGQELQLSFKDPTMASFTFDFTGYLYRKDTGLANLVEINVEVSDSKFIFDASFQDVSNSVIIFKQDHISNLDNTIVFGILPDDISFLNVSTQTVVGSAGYSGSYTSYQVTDTINDFYYSYYNSDYGQTVKIYYVKIDTNIVGNVFYLSEGKNNIYYPQIDITNNANEKLFFYLDFDISNTNINFGNVSGTENSDIVTTNISTEYNIISVENYTGNLYYFNSENLFMGYVPYYDIKVDGTTYEPTGFNWYYYDGYFNDDINWFDARTPSTSSDTHGMSYNGTNIATLTNNYVNFNFDNKSVQWISTFKPLVSGTHTFNTSSDDASYLWIGDTAESGYTIANALVNNGGAHGMQVRTGTIDLDNNTVYHLRAFFGESGGGEGMILWFVDPNGTTVYDFTDYLVVQVGSVVSADSLLTVKNVKVQNNKFYIDDELTPALTDISDTMIVFRQDDPSNLGNTIVFGNIIDTNGTLNQNQIIMGTAGTSGSYTALQITGYFSEFYFSFQNLELGISIPTYYVTLGTNFGGDTVYSLQLDGETEVYTQALIEFGPGTLLRFNVSSLPQGYNLVFGTEIDSAPDTTVVQQDGNTILLRVGVGTYYYYDLNNSGMGYVTPQGGSTISHTDGESYPNQAIAFKTPGTYTVTIAEDTLLETLVVAGGGSGGREGGGGAGGVLYNQSQQFTAGTYTITVGDGGKYTGTDIVNNYTSAGNSQISGGSINILSYGGGVGKGHGGSNSENGGSGGGAQRHGDSKGTGIAGQGHDGGSRIIDRGWCGGSGGGGAGEAGHGGGGLGQQSTELGGNGGDGIECDILGTSYYWGGGGGGGMENGAHQYGGNGGKGGGGGAAGGNHSASNDFLNGTLSDYVNLGVDTSIIRGTGGGYALNAGESGTAGSDTERYGGKAGANTGGGGGSFSHANYTNVYNDEMSQGGSGIVVLLESEPVQINEYYVVKVINGTFYIDDVRTPHVQFEQNSLYLFKQDDPSNKGNTLVIGTVLDMSNSLVNQTVIGTAGQPGAYTLLNTKDFVSLDLHYFSYNAPNMGFSPYYYIKSSSNIFGNPVYSVVGPRLSDYTNQYDMFQNLGETYTINTSLLTTHTDIGFDTTPEGTNNSSLYVVNGDEITITNTNKIYYFNQSTSNMGYSPPNFESGLIHRYLFNTSDINTDYTLRDSVNSTFDSSAVIVNNSNVDICNNQLYLPESSYVEKSIDISTGTITTWFTPIN